MSIILSMASISQSIHFRAVFFLSFWLNNKIYWIFVNRFGGNDGGRCDFHPFPIIYHHLPKLIIIFIHCNFVLACFCHRMNYKSLDIVCVGVCNGRSIDSISTWNEQVVAINPLRSHFALCTFQHLPFTHLKWKKKFD